MNGGEALVASLIAHRVELAFTVPGESFLTVLEALRQNTGCVRTVGVRHESGGTFAAAGYAKLAHRPAAVFVSRGPGATNASIGVHAALQDSVPLLLFVGQVRRRSRGLGAFQEVDLGLMFAPLAKAVLEPNTAADVPATTARALRLTTAGRPGPVVVVLPRDLLEEDVGPAAVPPPPSPHRRPLPDPADAREIGRLIDAARRPLVVAGELVNAEGAMEALIALAEATGVPVTTAYRCQDAFPNDHPAYAGHLEINRAPFQRRAWDEADLVIAVGSRLDGITTEDFTLLRPDDPARPLVCLHPDQAVQAHLGAAVAVTADTTATLGAVAAGRPPPPEERIAWRDRLHAAYLAFSTPGEGGDARVEGEVDPASVVAAVAARVPPEATIVTDGGSFSRWVHRYHRFTRPRTQVGPMSGAMGYAVPGALGAHIARPESPTVAFVGDGAFMMTGQELATAVEAGLPIKVVLGDNGAQGSILAAQRERFGPGSAHATLLRSPDFAAVARAYGAAAWTVRQTDEFDDAFRAALAHNGPALVHVLTDRRDISPYGGGRDAV